MNNEMKLKWSRKTNSVVTFHLTNGEIRSSHNIKNPAKIVALLSLAQDLTEYEQSYLADLIRYSKRP